MLSRTGHLFKLFLLFGVLLFTACSTSFKILDTWTSEEFVNLENKKVLVVCKTANKEYRKQIENDIVRRLKSHNVTASESNIMLPFLQPPESKEEERKIKELIRESGYDGLILAAVKNTIRSIKSGTSYSIEDGDIPGPESFSTTYVIEANVYDLNREDGTELVGVNLVGVTDPKSLEKLSKSYSKLIRKQFNRGM